jgi:antitoxin component YwqK of YwqJK toxin-antitoxin module
MSKRNVTTTEVIVKKFKFPNSLKPSNYSTEHRDYPNGEIRSSTNYVDGTIHGYQMNYSDKNPNKVVSDITWDNGGMSQYNTYWDNEEQQLSVGFTPDGKIIDIDCYNEEGVKDFTLSFSDGKLANEASYITKDGKPVVSYEDYLLPVSSKYVEQTSVIQEEDIENKREYYPSGNVKSVTNTNMFGLKHRYQCVYPDEQDPKNILEFNVWKHDILVHKTVYWKDLVDITRCKFQYSDNGVPVSTIGYTTEEKLDWIILYDEQCKIIREIEYYDNTGFEDYYTNIKRITRCFNNNTVISNYDKSGLLTKYTLYRGEDNDEIPFMEINNVGNYRIIDNYYPDGKTVCFRLLFPHAHQGIINAIKEFYENGYAKRKCRFTLGKIWLELEYNNSVQLKLTYKKCWDTLNIISRLLPLFEKTYCEKKIIHKQWYITGELETVYYSTYEADVTNQTVYYKNGVIKTVMWIDLVDKDKKYIESFYENSLRKSFETFNMEGKLLSHTVCFRKD